MVIPTGVTASVVSGALLIMTALEIAVPLRRTVEPKVRRMIRNLGTAGVAFAFQTALLPVILLPVTRLVDQRGIGLLHLFAMPGWLRLALGILLLDWTLWYWHLVNHRVPFFWRFHAVHHADLDLDASTALRFHFGEMTLSIPYRSLQVLVLGVDGAVLSIWQLMLFVSILFHHSNARLPIALERRLVHLVVTPRMHGIHHSIVPDESNANYSSLLTVWDLLHGTLRLDVPQADVVIGIPSRREPREVTFGRMQAAPFIAAPPTWRLPSGDPPPRHPETSHPGRLRA